MKFATSYFGSRILSHVKEDMRRLRREGFDVVVHTYSENDFEFYEGTMRNIVFASKDADLEVWLDPWGIGGVFGGEAYSRKALTEKAWLQVSADNKELPACCPNNPDFRGFVGDWIHSACATAADAIFWDEPHFFAGNGGRQAACYCEHCKLAANETGRQTSQQTSAGNFFDLIFPLVQGHKKQNVLCLLPEHLQAYQTAALKSLPALDNLGTDPYWFHTTAAAELGTDVIAVWGIDGCAAMSSIACERPQIAWKSFLRGIELVRNQT